MILIERIVSEMLPNVPLLVFQKELHDRQVERSVLEVARYFVERVDNEGICFVVMEKIHQLEGVLVLKKDVKTGVLSLRLFAIHVTVLK